MRILHDIYSFCQCFLSEKGPFLLTCVTLSQNDSVFKEDLWNFVMSLPPGVLFSLMGRRLGFRGRVLGGGHCFVMFFKILIFEIQITF